MTDPSSSSSSSSSKDMQGLTTAQAEKLLEECGKNEIPENITPWYWILAKQFIGIMPFMIEIACVLALLVQDWLDFGLIFAMLSVNGIIGFYEEWKAQISVQSLRSDMEQKISVKRDGKFQMISVTYLVPGDIIFLKGGQIVPADCTYLEGDVALVDTAALTGEPFPRKVPDDKHPDKPPILLSGFIMRQGEIYAHVDKTGLKTEIGQAAECIQEASGPVEGLFESQIYMFTKFIIAVTIIDVIIVAWYQVQIRNANIDDTLLIALSITIASVPIALPMVMTITQAIGAQKMSVLKVIVTHLGALQEIASMTVLCSDKTGTLTTAQISIIPALIKNYGDTTTKGMKWSNEDILFFTGLGANPDNMDDPIDSAVTKSCDQVIAGMGEKRKEWKIEKMVGFNPITKRTITYVTNISSGIRYKLCKGLTSKVLATGKDDGHEVWKCKNYTAIAKDVLAEDEELGRNGYKTIGLAVGIDDGKPSTDAEDEQSSTWEFVGVVPMLDPPREDTKETIAKIRHAGIRVKMITGDHANIAKETARMIGLGQYILPREEIAVPSALRDATIESADGFASVLPRDKQEVVHVLQQQGYVVGMTGDGVNDAPALAQANIGIAVEGATDAARSSADLVLTMPGLSPIFTAVVESRKIFKRLRSYILYRLASTVQIVMFLTVLVFAYDQEVAASYVVLLALLNDITMLMVAYDNATPSLKPDVPTLEELTVIPVCFGVALTLQSLMFYNAAFYYMSNSEYADNDDYRQVCIYYQITVAIELLVLSTRTTSFFFLSLPSWQLSLSILIGLFLITILVSFGWLTDEMEPADMAIIWLYNLVWFVINDTLKVAMFAAYNLSFGFGRNSFRLPTLEDIMEDDLENQPMITGKEKSTQLTPPRKEANKKRGHTRPKSDVSFFPNNPGAVSVTLKPGLKPEE